MTEPLSIFELLELSIDLFKYQEREFDCDAIEKITQDEDLTVDILYKDGSHEIVKNAVNIENLKMCINN